MTKRIRQKAFDPTKLKLSPEEGFVLSRVEGTTTTKELVALTGLEESRVESIIERLQYEDVIELEAPPEKSTKP